MGKARWLTDWESNPDNLVAFVRYFDEIISLKVAMQLSKNTYKNCSSVKTYLAAKMMLILFERAHLIVGNNVNAMVNMQLESCSLAWLPISTCEVSSDPVG